VLFSCLFFSNCYEYFCSSEQLSFHFFFLSISNIIFLRLFDSHSQTVALLPYFFIIYSSLFLPSLLWVFLSLDILVFPFVSCLYSFLSHCIWATARHIEHSCTALHLLVFPHTTVSKLLDTRAKTRVKRVCGPHCK